MIEDVFNMVTIARLDMEFLVSFGIAEQSKGFTITINPQGWFLTNDQQQGTCDATGAPVLYEYLKENHVQYPPGLGNIMRELWESAIHLNLPEDNVQRHLNDISEWIRLYHQRSHKNVPVSLPASSRMLPT